jgi:hypothetical protein
MKARVSKEEEYPVYHLRLENEEKGELAEIDDWTYIDYINALRRWRAVQEEIKKQMED